MNRQPTQPSEGATKLEFLTASLQHGFALSDDSHRPFIKILEAWGVIAARRITHFGSDQLGGKLAHLNRSWCDPRDACFHNVRHRSYVADSKDVFMAWQAAISCHDNTARAVRVDAELRSPLTRPNTCGPKNVL